MTNEIVYGNGSNSSVGSQIRTDYYDKMALIEVVKEQYFGQLADTISMPKNMGKTIKKYHYLPILDDRNLNDQGIDALGVATATSATKIAYIKAVAPAADGAGTFYFRGQSTVSAAEALLKAKANANAFLYQQGFTVVQASTAADYTALTALATGWTFTVYDATTTTNYGNLYGSSKDVGTIQGKIPALSETGGRVNRVGMRRIEIESSLEKFGFFDEFTQESMDFDSDPELYMHMSREMLRAANEITEDQLQIDLLNGAGVVRFTGAATGTSTLAGDPVRANSDEVTYDDLVKLAIELDNNRTPKQTKVIKGSRMVDTKVVNAARFIYVGSEMQPSLMRMTDYHGNKAFLPVAQYADAGNVVRGEFGSVDNFRFIVVPEMAFWQGAGAAVGAGDEETTLHRYSTGADGTSLNYDVFPMLVVGDGSFTTIGFQTDGKTTKFKITTKKPGVETADRNDPFGEMGFSSIKWYYSTLILRPERIALIKTVAEW